MPGILPRLLLIEDSPLIVGALTAALRNTYEVVKANGGELGLVLAAETAYDAIVLDLALPDMPGLEVCKQLRARDARTPIIILTAEAGILSKIQLLDAGANDYLTKPFSLGEFKARLRTARRHLSDRPQRIVHGQLVLDSRTQQVECSGNSIPLSRKEFALLECLMSNAGSVVPRAELGSYAWQTGGRPPSSTLHVHMKHLRDKLHGPATEPLITTVHGVGYRLESP